MPPSRICYIVNMCQSLQEIFPQVNIYEMKCASTLMSSSLPGSLRSTHKEGPQARSKWKRLDNVSRSILSHAWSTLTPLIPLTTF